jgi:hypothetical protein
MGQVVSKSLLGLPGIDWRMRHSQTKTWAKPGQNLYRAGVALCGGVRLRIIGKPSSDGYAKAGVIPPFRMQPRPRADDPLFVLHRRPKSRWRSYGASPTRTLKIPPRSGGAARCMGTGLRE